MNYAGRLYLDIPYKYKDAFKEKYGDAAWWDKDKKSWYLYVGYNGETTKLPKKIQKIINKKETSNYVYSYIKFEHNNTQNYTSTITDMKLRKLAEQTGVIEEAFKAPALSKLASYTKSGSKNAIVKIYDKIKIQWSEVPRQYVRSFSDGMAAYKFIGNNPDYLVFWVTTEDIDRQTVAFELDPKGGAFKINAGLLAITRGKKPVMEYESYGDKTRYGSWDKSRYNGLTSTKKVAQFSDYVVVINVDELEKEGFGSKEKRVARTDARRGATALKDAHQIAKENNERYKKILRDRAADISVKNVFSKMFARINYLSQNAIEKEIYAENGYDLLAGHLDGKEVEMGGNSWRGYSVLEYGNKAYKLFETFKRAEERESKYKASRADRDEEKGYRYTGYIDDMNEAKKELKDLASELNSIKPV